jgi:hypothetical protein
MQEVGIKENENMNFKKFKELMEKLFINQADEQNEKKKKK